VLEQVCAGGVIPVVVIDDAELAPLLGAALKLGGLPVVEVTFRTAGAVEALRALATDAELLVGAGTVVRPEQVDWARDAGASFVVTPGFSRTVVERCRELGMAVLPGVATASEVIAALDWGIDLVKFFPAEVSGGVAMLRALSAPFPRVRFVPTGASRAWQRSAAAGSSTRSCWRRETLPPSSDSRARPCGWQGRRGRERSGDPRRDGLPLRPRRAR
jgi:2-dehydro-3-deoxyphosphogluconate aldolase/(4S)-4-hydroxy-2-oxoglutarate aldolase